MLDTDTKRRIDTARDILVGKVPDPKSQVEQITIALIYKFMDDMDLESEELGGHRKFFAGEFSRYSWAKLMHSGLGGHEVLNLYAEAISKMPENPGIPPLFRDIFKNAFLPYRDPETLRAFLKIIDEFEYDHSEKLGDAFEYLLSVLGSQGDAGQFRTPRHIIDFMVKLVDPKKDEIILDPACGTAGFLISSYKHIMKGNQDDNGSSTLTPDDRKRLAENFKGYDISPDMIRLSLVNLYLHGINDPHIHEYDTLTSQDKWNEYADVILANPPFMSPKGGIRPHNRFTVQSKRSEVLFVDYMAEHLTPNGRAGIIVPEGIIFQSQTAYKQLRKMLVEDYLVAVISLPAGVFNPYSGVKTSILILDKFLAKKSDVITFFKVENDGFGLGAQRRPIEKNDLPQVTSEVIEFLQKTSDPHSIEDFLPLHGLVVQKDKVAADGDYNLSGERYRDVIVGEQQYPLVYLNDPKVFRIESGGTPKSKIDEYWNGDIQWATLVDLPADNFVTEITSTQRTITELGLQKSSAKLLPINTVIISSRATIGRIGINRVPLATNQGFKNIIIEDPNRAIPEFIAFTIKNIVPVMESWATGGTFKEISKTKIGQLHIPLPPLDVQEEIVAEIEGYQKVIDGARAVIDNYRPHISIDPEWPMVDVGDVFMRSDSTVIPSTISGPINFVGLKDITQNTGEIVGEIRVDDPSEIKSTKVVFTPNDVLYGKLRPNLNKVWLADREGICSTDIFVVRAKDDSVIPALYAEIFRSKAVNQKVLTQIKGAQLPRVGWKSFSKIQIPLPPIDDQKVIIDELTKDRVVMSANKGLISRMEKKIQATLARVWGEEKSNKADEG